MRAVSAAASTPLGSSCLHRSARFGMEIRHALPLVRDVPHEEGGVELDAPLGKPRLVREIGGVNRFQQQWLYLPHLRAKTHAVQPVAVPRRRVSQGTGFKEG